MNDREKAECLIELNKAKLSHFMQTRTIEFQVNIAIWTMIIVMGSLHDKVYLKTCCWCVYFVIALVIFLLHVFWMNLIQRSEDSDKDCMRNYIKRIEELTGIKNLEPENQVRFGGWWIILETLMTLALLIAVGILFLMPPMPNVMVN